MNSHDYIDKYFEGSLTPEEQQEFESLLLSDDDLANNFAYQKQLKKAITLNERADLKRKLQGFESETRKPKSFKVWYAAASVVLLCCLGYYFSMTSTSGLYDDYYQTYPNVVAPTVRGEGSEDLTSKAFYNYDAGNYEQSAELFSSLYDTTHEDYALFYKGMSLMELKEHKQAIGVFNQFDESKQSRFTPFVKWYKALSYLKLGNKEKSISLLKDLSNTENPQQKQAKQLLTELE